MSDFENLLQSPTFDTFVERLGEWTVGLLRKGVSVGWTELEGVQLLYAWTGKKVPTSSSLMARREFRFTQNGSLKGLKWAALVFEKDERTIRRWCEKKYFKSATQTPGGHWRIEPEEVERLRGKLRGRGPRRLFTTRVWKDFMKEGPASFLKLLGQATAMEAALQDGSQSALRSVPLVPSDQAFAVLPTSFSCTAAVFRQSHRLELPASRPGTAHKRKHSVSPLR
jgi:hypothetical protein